MSINSSRKIPSVNVPFVDGRGKISPVWHEFLRSFVSSAVDTNSTGTTNAALNIVAGPGLTSTSDSTDLTLAIGAGFGLNVQANDVNVDIDNQSYIKARASQYVMVSDGGTIKKTLVGDIITPIGGLPTNVQYNSAGDFTGNSGLTYDGAGNLYASSSITSASVVKAGASGIILTSAGGADTIYFNGTSSATGAHMQGTGDGGILIYSYAAGASQAWMQFSGSADNITFNYTGSRSVTLDSEGWKFAGNNPLRRCLTNSITADTVQTQGQGALTRDYNDVTIVANANDVVTLPANLSARYCLVRNSGANILQVYPASGSDLGFGTNTSMTLSPGELAIWYSIDTTTWYQITGIQKNSVKSGITASTTQTQGQMPLTKDVNEISTVANANDTVTLPSATSYSRSVVIINNGANTLKIYPASGDNLGAGVNTSTTLASGSNVRYTNYDSTNWEAV